MCVSAAMTSTLSAASAAAISARRVWLPSALRHVTWIVFPQA
jgi:hypothetical protein